MHGAGEPKGRLVGQKKRSTANDHEPQRLTMVSVAQESGLVYANEETLFSQGLSLSIKAEISSRLQEEIRFPHHVVGAGRGLWLPHWLRV